MRAADRDDRYADIHVDHAKARAVYRKWLALARPAAGDLRRPIWLFRPVKPAFDAHLLPQDERTETARRARTQQPPPSALDLADLVDWSPERVWGRLADSGRILQPSRRLGRLNARPADAARPAGPGDRAQPRSRFGC